jgi:hypothetical protein
LLPKNYMGFLENISAEQWQIKPGTIIFKTRCLQIVHFKIPASTIDLGKKENLTL